MKTAIDIKELQGALKVVIEAQKSIVERIDYCNKMEENINAKTNDIEHKMELLDLKDSELLDLAYQMQYLKRERRAYKDEAELLSPFLGVFNNPDIIKATAFMQNKTGEIAKAIKNHKDRIYKLRGEDGIIARTYLENELKTSDDVIIYDTKLNKAPSGRNALRKKAMQQKRKGGR